MDKTVEISEQGSIFLPEKYVEKLQTHEDYVNFFLQLEEISDSASWYQADTLLHYTNRFGMMSLGAIARDVKKPRTTVVGYVRTARAFPPSTRLQELSFTHHYQASFADSYDEKTATFLTDTRFELVHEAMDQGMSTRQLQDKVFSGKKKTPGPKICSVCNLEEGETREYIVAPTINKKELHVFEAHAHCYAKILNFIYHGAAGRKEEH